MKNPTEKADVKACLEACEKCSEICDKAAAEDARLNAPGRSEFGVSCADAADICRATAAALRRESPQHPDFCALCAQICRLCASLALPHATTSELHQVCENACTGCADECALHAVEKTQPQGGRASLPGPALAPPSPAERVAPHLPMLSPEDPNPNTPTSPAA